MTKVLEMNHVKKSFDNMEVLKDISINVNEGEVVSIIGPSGSGKTRFVLKPNLLQMHSSYVVTDPKGYFWIGQ